MISKYKKWNNQLNKSAAYIFISLCLVLTLFYFSVVQILSKYFVLDTAVVSQITFLYVLFSMTVALLFLIFAVGANRMIYGPLDQVLDRIRDFRKNSDENSAVSIQELPDFWNDIELEVLEVVSFLKKNQRQSERVRGAIQNILNVFPEPTLVVNTEGNVRYFNRSFEKTFGASIFSNRIHISSIIREPQVFSALQGQESFTNHMDLDIQTPDGKRNFIMFKTPYATRSEDGGYDTLMIFHDVTAQKKTEQMKTNFVSNVSHELRTPLMTMQGYLQILREDFFSGNTQALGKYIEIIESNMFRLTQLVGDLLELSVLESDSALQKTNVCSKDLTAKVLSQFTTDMVDGGYLVDAVWAGESNVWGHERLIEQVLINFMQNALRHTPRGTHIRIEWKELSGGMELIFKDSGPGIALEHQDQIFERFYRIDPHRSRQRGGTGLGLSIVKHIIQRHGGTIRVQSQPGDGVEFSCYFPSKE